MELIKSLVIINQNCDNYFAFLACFKLSKKRAN